MVAINPPFFMQTGAHPAQAFRRALEASHRYSGVINPTGQVPAAGDLAVIPGAGRSVDVLAGDCIIIGTENPLRQGAYACTNDATVNVPIAVADATNPRHDIVYAQVRDAEFSGAFSDWRIAVAAGVPAAAPLDPALPANSLPLGRVLVDALAAGPFAAAKLTDMRPAARGSGGFLTRAEATATGTSAAGLHDAGAAFQVTFVMPLLGAGQAVEVVASPYYLIHAAAPAAGTFNYLHLVDAANVVKGSVASGYGGAGTSSGTPPVRALVDNADYAAYSLVTMRLRLNSSGAPAIAVYADATGPTDITARVG